MRTSNSRIWPRRFPRRCQTGRRCAPSADTRNALARASSVNTRSPLHVDVAMPAQCTGMLTPGRCGSARLLLLGILTQYTHCEVSLMFAARFDANLGIEGSRKL
jgi:hypothetical protein